MDKTHDYIYHFRGFYSLKADAMCRIRIYEDTAGEEPPVIICTELPENESTSITNLCEYLAAEIVFGHKDILLCGRTGIPFIWIEHYPERQPDPSWRDPIFAESFDSVTFSFYEPKGEYFCGVWRHTLGCPNWKRSSKEEIELFLERTIEDRSEVEHT